MAGYHPSIKVDFITELAGSPAHVHIYPLFLAASFVHVEAEDVALLCNEVLHKLAGDDVAAGANPIHLDEIGVLLIFLGKDRGDDYAVPSAMLTLLPFTVDAGLAEALGGNHEASVGGAEVGGSYEILIVLNEIEDIEWGDGILITLDQIALGAPVEPLEDALVPVAWHIAPVTNAP